jgi:HAD superfamily hydrolase (TIGR01509 family)
MIKLVIFDLDGVLVNACEWHRIALNKALKEICDYEISLEDHYCTFNGIPTKIKLKKLTELGIIPKEKHEKVSERKQDLTVEIINHNAFYRKEKVEMIDYLHSKGILVACYTNSIRRTAVLMLEKTGVLQHLDYLLTNEDVENNKPAPDGYLLLLDKFNVKTKDVIIVEDSPKGIAAAKAAGCNVMKVSNADDVDKDLFKGLV